MSTVTRRDVYQAGKATVGRDGLHTRVKDRAPDCIAVENGDGPDGMHRVEQRHAIEGDARLISGRAASPERAAVVVAPGDPRRMLQGAQWIGFAQANGGCDLCIRQRVCVSDEKRFLPQPLGACPRVTVDDWGGRACEGVLGAPGRCALARERAGANWRPIARCGFASASRWAPSRRGAYPSARTSSR